MNAKHDWAAKASSTWSKLLAVIRGGDGDAETILITALREAARVPEGCVRTADGVDRKVIGGLPITADNYVVGLDAVVYWSNGAGHVREMRVDDRLHMVNGMVAIPSECYSTREAALAQPTPARGEGVGPSLIAGLTDLRDTLQRGESLGAHYKITQRELPPLEEPQ